MIAVCYDSGNWFSYNNSLPLLHELGHVYMDSGTNIEHLYYVRPPSATIPLGGIEQFVMGDGTEVPSWADCDWYMHSDNEDRIWDRRDHFDGPS